MLEAQALQVLFVKQAIRFLPHTYDVVLVSRAKDEFTARLGLVLRQLEVDMHGRAARGAARVNRDCMPVVVIERRGQSMVPAVEAVGDLALTRELKLLSGGLKANSALAFLFFLYGR